MTDVDSTGWRRLHPAGMIVALIASVKTMVGIVVSWAVAFAVVRDKTGAPSWVLAMLAVLVVAAVIVQPVVKWLTTRYRLDDDGLTFTTGLLFRKHRTIGYAHMHAIDATSPIYLQAFHVVSLTVSAGGLADANIVLDAVPADTQHELEARRRAAQQIADGEAAAAKTNADNGDSVLGGALPAAPVNAPSRLVFRASLGDILLYALTDLGIFAAGFAVWGVVQQAEEVLPKQWMQSASDSLWGFVAHGVFAIAALLAIAVIVLAAVSIVTSLLRFYGFEIRRQGDDLLVTRGLLTRRTTTIPVGRIQSVTIRGNMLRRALHLCSVQVGLGAAPGGEASADASRTNIVPVIGDRKVYALLHDALPEWDMREPSVKHTGRGLLRYFLFAPILAEGIIIAVTLVVVLLTDMPWWVLLGEIVVALFWPALRVCKSRTEGFAFLDGLATDVVDDADVADVDTAESAVVKSGCGTNPLIGDGTDPTATAGISPHRIAVTGTYGWTFFTMFTRRQRVQSIERRTTIWREKRGVERVIMPVFVMNGIHAIDLYAIRRGDAEMLERWATDFAESS